MIVRNEEAVIERALKSAKPFISSWAIVDTGSTDKTMEIIRTVMADVSGTLYEHPWVNFGYNRTKALALSTGDWSLMLDADDTMGGTLPPAEIFARTDIDAFFVHIKHGNIVHRRLQLFRTASNWAYEGAVHESPVSGKEKNVLAHLPDMIYMETRCEGFRSKNPQKYQDDAKALEEELVRRPGHPRSTFYLAQSYRDSGNTTKAVEVYKRYLELPNSYAQEKYISIINIVSFIEDRQLQIDLTWKAIDLLPNRLEAPFTLLNVRRKAGLPPTMQMFAIASCIKNREANSSDLFVIPAIYDWGMDDELAIVAFQLKQYRESMEASQRSILKCPEEMRSGAIKNANVASKMIK
jgi:glycosyltransferase involved in cell wall biosynthesis